VVKVEESAATLRRRRPEHGGLRSRKAGVAQSLPRQDRTDPPSSFHCVLVLPNTDGNPTSGSKESVCLSITLSIALDLRRPERAVHPVVALTMNRTTVPKTTIDEHGDTLSGEQDVRGAIDAVYWVPMEVITKTACP
jgi:hypothetical protein